MKRKIILRDCYLYSKRYNVNQILAYSVLFLFLLIISCLLTVPDITASSLIDDVKSCPYNVSEYQFKVFDCSNMATMLYDWLSLHKHDCTYVEVHFPKQHAYHACLYCEGYFIEATQKDYAWWYYNHWDGWEYDEIHYVSDTELFLDKLRNPQEYWYPESRFFQSLGER